MEAKERSKIVALLSHQMDPTQKLLKQADQHSGEVEKSGKIIQSPNFENSNRVEAHKEFPQSTVSGNLNAEGSVEI